MHVHIHTGRSASISKGVFLGIAAETVQSFPFPWGCSSSSWAQPVCCCAVHATGIVRGTVPWADHQDVCELWAGHIVTRLGAKVTHHRPAGIAHSMTAAVGTGWAPEPWGSSPAGGLGRTQTAGGRIRVTWVPLRVLLVADGSNDLSARRPALGKAGFASVSSGSVDQPTRNACDRGGVLRHCVRCRCLVPRRIRDP
jgi:hypothetical protein